MKGLQASAIFNDLNVNEKNLDVTNYSKSVLNFLKFNDISMLPYFCNRVTYKPIRPGL